ncbi:MAG: hypothetical protein GH150_02305 [Hadesarchaea archaeon]|nr:hypothetical protein [Hadesarchaea archaeon]
MDVLGTFRMGAGRIPGTNAARDRRDLTALYADILRTIESRARKSRIVYGANLNFGRCKRYLEELRGMGLIEVKTRSPPTWAVTKKGREFLEKYGEFKRFLLPR